MRLVLGHSFGGSICLVRILCGKEMVDLWRTNVICVVSLYIDVSKVGKSPGQTSAEIISATSWVKCLVGCRVYAICV